MRCKSADLDQNCWIRDGWALAELVAQALLLQVDVLVGEVGGSANDCLKAALWAEDGRDGWQETYAVIPQRLKALRDSGRLASQVGVVTAAAWGPWRYWLFADLLLHAYDDNTLGSQGYADWIATRLPMALAAAESTPGLTSLAVNLVGAGWRVRPNELAVDAMVRGFTAARHFNLHVHWALPSADTCNYAEECAKAAGLLPR